MNEPGTDDPHAPGSPTSAPADAAPEQASRWEDYIDIYLSPVELFVRRARDRIAPPLLTLLALALAFYFLLLPANRMVLRASAPPNPEAAQALERMEGIMTIVFAVTTPLVYLVVIAVTAGLLWIVGRFADIRIDFDRAMLIATYGGFIYLLAQVAGSAAVLLHGEAGLDIVRHMSFGPLRFLGDADMNRALIAVLRRFEIFFIWQAIIWAIGLRVIYNVSYARAAVVAGVTWALFVIPGLIGSLLNFGPQAAG